MVAGEDASGLAVKKEQKEGPYIAKPMEVVIVANILAAQEVLKAALITALPTVVVGAAATPIVFVLQEEDLVCA